MHYFIIFLILIFPQISFSQTIETKEIANADYASVIMYHRFGDSRYPSTNIKKEQFESHINELIKPKYNVIDIKKALKAINEEELINDRSIVITIDDAYSSVFDYAWPIFKKHNLPFTLFVSTDVIDKKIPGYMSWEEIRILRDNGITIGSQTKSHPHLHKLTKSQDVIDKKIPGYMSWEESKNLQFLTNGLLTKLGANLHFLLILTENIVWKF